MMVLHPYLRGPAQAALAALCLATSIHAQSSQKPFVVSATGEKGYRKIQQAIEDAPATGAVILIEPGSYREKILVKKPGIRLVGLGKTSSDVTLTFGDSAKSVGSTFRSATLTVLADDFAAENLSIVNTWWDEHIDADDPSQAVALQLVGDREVLDRVRLISGQDTLYAASSTCQGGAGGQPCMASRQLFDECYIEGNIDYIFGDARAVFNRCELHSRPHPSIMITAQGRNSLSYDSGYYFLHCSITGANNGDQVYLGRPWRDYATVLFFDTEMKQKLAADGWSDWGGRLKTSTYREYGSHGPGANDGHRIIAAPALSKTEEESLTPHGLLGGNDHWSTEEETVELRRLARQDNVSGR